MKKKAWSSAEEFMAQLQQDPTFVEQQRSREHERVARQRKIRELHAPIIDHLHQIGVNVNSLEELPLLYAPLGENIVDVLLAWIKTSSEPDVLEPLVRALAATTVRYDGRPVIGVFSKSNSEFVRWAAANTLATTSPTGVTEWIIDAVTNPEYGRAREMLLIALARNAPASVANPLLCSIFDQMPSQTAEAWKISGGDNELQFLQSRRDKFKGRVGKQIDQAIQVIQKRIVRSGRPN